MDITRQMVVRARERKVLVACYTQGQPVIYVSGRQCVVGEDVLTREVADDVRRYLRDSRQNEFEALHRLGWATWDEVFDDEVVRLVLSSDSLGMRLVLSRMAAPSATLQQLQMEALASLIQRPGLVVVAGPGSSARRTTSHALFDYGIAQHAIGSIIERGRGLIHPKRDRVILQYDVGDIGFPRHVATYGEGLRAAMTSRATLILLDGVDSADDISAVCRASEEGATVILRLFGATVAHAMQALLRRAVESDRERLIEAFVSGAALRSFERTGGRAVVAEIVRGTERVRSALSKGAVDLTSQVSGTAYGSILIDDALDRAVSDRRITADEAKRSHVFR